MQYLKKSDYIKNKQLSLSLRYIFVKMLLNGQEIINAVISSVFLPTGSPTAAL